MAKKNSVPEQLEDLIDDRIAQIVRDRFAKILVNVTGDTSEVSRRETTTLAPQPTHQELIKWYKLLLAHEAAMEQDHAFTTGDSITNLAERIKKLSRSDAWGKVIQELLQESGTDYPTSSTSVSELRHSFHQGIARFLQPQLNEHLKSMPHESYEDKQALASWVNGQLRQFGLAIKCPKTGRPAILLADVKDSNAAAGRFRLEIRDDEGKKVRTYSSRELPNLELTEDDLRREPLAEWTRRVRDDSNLPRKR